jgi:hypothetical protein
MMPSGFKHGHRSDFSVKVAPKLIVTFSDDTETRR